MGGMTGKKLWENSLREVIRYEWHEEFGQQKIFVFVRGGENMQYSHDRQPDVRVQGEKAESTVL